MDDEPLFPQFLYIQTLEEEISVDMRSEGGTPDHYWAQGWSLSPCRAVRRNFDDYQHIYEKAFPTRYRLDEFSLSRSLKRVLAKNTDLRYVIRPLRITPAKESLYFLHNISRFGTPPKEPLVKTYEYILMHPAELMELCVFDGDDLIAFSIFAVGEHSMWSDIGVWASRHAGRSLGTLTILKEMMYAHEMGCDYYYIGHFYLENPSYNYKMNFPGMELFDWDNERWVKFSDPYTSELLSQRLPRRK